MDEPIDRKYIDDDVVYKTLFQQPEDDTISRQTAIDAIMSLFGFNAEDEYGSALTETLNGLPSAQPERKTGKWRHYEGYLSCSECGTEYDDDIMTHCCDDVPKFCPNCGADMRGEEDGTT